MIVTHLDINNQTIRTGIGYEQSMIEIPLLWIICGNSGHAKQNCLKYRVNCKKNKTRGTSKIVQRNMYTQRKTNLSKWAHRDLIHSF